jgi:DNA mismatch endonuclease (patch repair protein)
VPRQPKADAHTSPERSRIMRAVRRQNTGPERMLQTALRALQLRFSKNCRDLPGSPDVVFRQEKVAVFVHGCFWHRHAACPRATMPRSNIRYWKTKFAANLERDRQKLLKLKKLGWKAIVLWQCEIEADPAKAARRVRSTVLRAQRNPPAPALGSQSHSPRVNNHR